MYIYCILAICFLFKICSYRLGASNKIEKGKPLRFVLFAHMTELYDAAKNGNLERVATLVEQGMDKNQVGGQYGQTPLCAASLEGHIDIVRYLVEQGADMEETDIDGSTPLIFAAWKGHYEEVCYLLQQGANRDNADYFGNTPLHCAAMNGHLETAKLLMVYGANLNARNNNGQLAIDMHSWRNNEEIRQAIRDEPRRRMDEAPGKRATEEDRYPNAAASAQHEDEQEDEEKEMHNNKRSLLDEGAAVVEETKVAEEHED